MRSRKPCWALLLQYRRESTLGGLLLAILVVSFLQSWVLMGRFSTSAVKTLVDPPTALSSVGQQFFNGPSTGRHLSLATKNVVFSQSVMEQWLSSAAETQPPNTPGAFLHLGKTGGSTLSNLLRNGCHSTVLPKPCHNVTEPESYLSLLSTYYHMPDFAKLMKNSSTSYAFYTLTLRDPLDRTISSFVYTHPANQEALANHVRYRHREFHQPCFPDLDHFADALHSFRPDTTDNLMCATRAHRSLHNQVQFVEHLYYDAKYMKRAIPANRPILVIRMENLTGDWISANRALGQDEKTLLAPQQQLRHIGTQQLPVGRNITEASRRFLCEALEDEYQVYLEFVWKAINLQERDRWDVYGRAKQRCPELNVTLPNLHA